jgi:hypothetical protein
LSDALDASPLVLKSVALTSAFTVAVSVIGIRPSRLRP